jgi:hypothetical protein
MDSANAVVSMRAPLGYLEPDKDATGWADCREVSFSARGDSIAVATFRFPTNQDRLNQVAAHLAKTEDAAAAGVVLTNTFGSAVRDGLCLVGTRTDT